MLEQSRILTPFQTKQTELLNQIGDVLSQLSQITQEIKAENPEIFNETIKVWEQKLAGAVYRRVYSKK